VSEAKVGAEVPAGVGAGVAETAVGAEVLPTEGAAVGDPGATGLAVLGGSVDGSKNKSRTMCQFFRNEKRPTSR
jgi:hypothetical protein